MNVFARLEAVCASAVERAFALAFPSELEPVQIARKLVAAFEAGGVPDGRGGRRFTVLLSANDLARFQPSRAYLERQWAAMLARLAERSGFPQRSPVVISLAMRLSAWNMSPLTHFQTLITLEMKDLCFELRNGRGAKFLFFSHFPGFLRNSTAHGPKNKRPGSVNPSTGRLLFFRLPSGLLYCAVKVYSLEVMTPLKLVHRVA